MRMCPHQPMRSTRYNPSILKFSKSRGPIKEEIAKSKCPLANSTCEPPRLYRTSSAPFMQKIKDIRTISAIKMTFASFVGHPTSSFIVKRGSLSKFRRAKKANVATKARTDKISMKLIMKV